MEPHEDKETKNGESHFSFGKALLAGLVGGVAGTAIKTLCELIAPPRAPGVESPLGNALAAVYMLVTGHGTPADVKPFAEPAVHWVFGTMMGAAYGLAAEKLPIVRLGKGVAFGVAFWLIFHEIGLPLMGLSPSPAKMTLWEQGNELVSHGLFGLTLELVRGAVRRKLA